jgi:anti-sigma28 factor (negative regulator of flagellin synthesis)
MDINRIANGGLQPDPSKIKKTKEDPGKIRLQGDKIDISDEAVSLFKTQENKRLEEIRGKIDSGYYFQRDITEKVVDAVMKDMKLA